MEGRKLKANFYKSGSGSISSKVNLPVVDFRDMGVTPEDKAYSYHYDKDNKLMILSKKNLTDYEVILKKKSK